jgi:tRNA(Arg) A34 adenosine deaminase TadA
VPHDHIHLTLPAWVADEIGAETVYPDDLTKMALAVRLSSRNVREASGGPFGAALFTEAGHLLGVGVNRVVSQNCSLAHAEMMAFATAQQAMNQFRLNQNGERIVLATSSQPCAMCYGASFWAGIDAVLIGARADDVQSLAGFDEGPLPADWIGEWLKRGIDVRRDILREDACAVLKAYGESGLVY